MKFSVIIPSKNIDNLIPCVEAVRRCEPEARIIVVDDGLDMSFLPRPDLMPNLFIRGISPFVFSRNINLGIRAAGADDVVILGDDGLLQTPCGFSTLAQAAEEHPEFGIISSTVNNVGNPNQWPKGIGLREDPRVVCFVAVYIPRRTIDLVGLMDESFNAYGFDDDDMCLRIRRAGLKIGIHDGCFVDHGSLKSTFRGNPETPANLTDGMTIFIEKWGSHPL